MIKPSLEDLTTYIKSKGYTVDPKAFLAFYDSNGWKVGKNPMKDWKRALVTWEGKNRAKPIRYDPNDISIEDFESDYRGKPQLKPYIEGIIKLKFLLQSKITKHGILVSATECYHHTDEQAFHFACKELAANFEPIPTKMFPLAKDFISYANRYTKVMANVDKGGNNKASVYAKYAKFFGMELEDSYAYPKWILQCAMELNLKHPGHLPRHANQLTPQQRITLNLADPEEMKQGWHNVKVALSGAGKEIPLETQPKVRVVETPIVKKVTQGVSIQEMMGGRDE